MEARLGLLGWQGWLGVLFQDVCVGCLGMSEHDPYNPVLFSVQGLGFIDGLKGYNPGTASPHDPYRICSSPPK